MCQKSYRSLKPFGHRQTDGRTDRRISYGIGLDLTVGQKLRIIMHKGEAYRFNHRPTLIAVTAKMLSAVIWMSTSTSMTYL